MKTVSSAKEHAIKILRRRKGLIRTSYALRKGIHPATLYLLRDEGIIEQVARGVYKLAERGLLSAPDLATVSSVVPGCIICLTSALSFYNLTTEIPHEVCIALGRTRRNPAIPYPPVRVFRFSGVGLDSGIERHTVDGVTLQIYSVGKTVVDCFRFRNKIGLSIAIEALKESILQNKTTRQEILHFAHLLRMTKVITPYLESLS